MFHNSIELLRVSGSAASKVKHNCTAWRSHACDWLCPPYGKGAASAVGHRQWLCSGEHARNVLLRSRVSVVPVQLGEAHLITRQTAAVTFLGIPRAKRTTLLPARVFLYSGADSTQPQVLRSSRRRSFHVEVAASQPRSQLTLPDPWLEAAAIQTLEFLGFPKNFLRIFLGS